MSVCLCLCVCIIGMHLTAMRGGEPGRSMSRESVVRRCGMWKRIRPGRSFSEHAWIDAGIGVVSPYHGKP